VLFRESCATSERARPAGTLSMGARVAVLAPAPYVSVTVEAGPDGGDEVHFHVGGQGYWIARLAAELGAEVTLCATIGGESGAVVEHLLSREPMAVETIETPSANGVYVHDRRTGDRTPIADTKPATLDRHAVDDLFGAALVAGADTGLLAVAGPPTPSLLTDGFYERLVTDARHAGATVVADVSGATLDEVLAAGIDVVKVSSEELRRDGLAADDVVAAARSLRDRGANAVVLTRAGAGTLVIDEDVTEVVAPRVAAVEPAGAGDSLTGALAAMLARGAPLLDAVRIGTAAAALNVTRRGLGSGRREDIERFAEHVEVRAGGTGEDTDVG
jgi:1-phosphofructokinase